VIAAEIRNAYDSISRKAIYKRAVHAAIRNSYVALTLGQKQS